MIFSPFSGEFSNTLALDEARGIREFLILMALSDLNWARLKTMMPRLSILTKNYKRYFINNGKPGKIYTLMYSLMKIAAIKLRVLEKLG